MSGTGSVDPITLEVIDNRIDEIVREMQHVMFRTGYSTIIRDSKDGSAGICLPDGRVIGQAFRLPLHCDVFPPTIDAIYEYYDVEDINEGDTFVMNNPYLSGANHTPDLMVATPVFDAEELQAFCLTIAHKPDMGGIDPGSMSPDAREIYHEGMLLPPVKYRREGEVNPDIENIIRNNSRTPEVTMGDVRGQVGSTNIGVSKFQNLLNEYGAETIHQAADKLLGATRTEVGQTIETWDGEVTVSGSLDNDVTSDEAIEIRLTVSTDAGDDSLHFDFAGSDAQSEGPSNLQPHVAKSACMIGVVGIIDPELPLNAGVANVCEFDFPQASIVNPSHPAPCGNYAKGMCVITHLSLRALSTFDPELGVAETGNKASIAVNYKQAGANGDEEVVHFEIMGSGYGANRLGDGADCMATSYESNVRFTPLEILETEYPVRMRQFNPRRDSAGAGEQRGGLGFIREYESLRPADFTYSGSNHHTRARGVAGGHDSATGRCRLNPDTEAEKELDTIENFGIDASDVLRIERPGGAGYGDPTERNPDAVLEDVRRGFVSITAAKQEYGVVIEEHESGLQINREATAETREDPPESGEE